MCSFGAKVAGAAGIVWNNEMDDFSQPATSNAFELPPSPANFIRAGKRPMSSMSPMIVTNHADGAVRLAIGAAGGSKIIASVAFVAVRVLLMNDSLAAAIDAPRLHNQLVPWRTDYERQMPTEVVRLLAQLGHNMTVMGEWSTVQTAVEQHGVANQTMLTAYCDARKGTTSYAAGYF